MPEGFDSLLHKGLNQSNCVLSSILHDHVSFKFVSLGVSYLSLKGLGIKFSARDPLSFQMCDLCLANASSCVQPYMLAVHVL
jgi:hypothetical protein